ncbi:MAG: DUF1294 domain-containing protein [Peptoniphilus harei]|uniref:DUF1294 domain-containing protein n=1 Tax=uncultured Peptoniphilus sp. TaxID=254354 RepID=UPI00258531F3|nr:DUF1294 domain-containing protein [uncultured Peptoniphilus sp.]MDU3009965.1 DUF1294 domain-containing protein [Peptoniphilus harei]MDU6783308.1 DUF1294 domain-containing protein [Peptoniphilus harei]MDU7114642.1 DUF1294 domain-containing protein [Peptoniphilus harei]
MENNYLIIILNLINFILYGIDKYKAKHNLWRISEKTLLTLSVLAGVGGILGMEIFHHKTREKKFYLANLIGIALTIYLVKN